MNGIDTHIFSYDHEMGLSKALADHGNRAAFFGDGLFETMVFTNGRIRFSKEHGERLEAGLKTLKINSSGLSIDQLEKLVQAQFTDKKDLRIRWNVFRSGLGKYTPMSNDARDLIFVQDLDKPIKIKNRAYISKTIPISASPWSHCKTLNALPYIMANIEREELGMDEVILLDDKGFISEAGAANIFWVKDQVFYTPSLTCNCIAGVGRRKIIETLVKRGTPVIEGKFSVQDVLKAEQLFTSNVTGIAYIAELDNRSYGTTPISLLELLFT